MENCRLISHLLVLGFLSECWDLNYHTVKCMVCEVAPFNIIIITFVAANSKS